LRLIWSGNIVSQYDSKKLKKAIENVITRAGFSPTDLMNDFSLKTDFINSVYARMHSSTPISSRPNIIAISLDISEKINNVPVDWSGNIVSQYDSKKLKKAIENVITCMQGCTRQHPFLAVLTL
jgi:predicted RNA binding protein with dsRBD fold (UPF0201 family)